MAHNHRPAVRGWDGAARGSLLETSSSSSCRGHPGWSSDDGTPRRTATDAMTHNSRWTLRWCEHSMGGRIDDGNLPARTHGAEQGRIWGKTELIGGPRLFLTTTR
jgi:hypothetical protein